MSLSDEQIKEFVADSEYTRTLPTTDVFGTKVSTDSLVIFLVGAIVYALLWQVFGLFKLSRYAFVFFVAYLVVSFGNVLGHSASTNVTVDSALTDIQDQAVRIEGALAITVLIYGVVWLSRFDDKVKRDVSLILTISILLQSMALVTLASGTNTERIRQVRLVKEVLGNQGLFLLAFAVVLLMTGTRGAAQ